MILANKLLTFDVKLGGVGVGGLFLVYNSSCRTKKPIIKEIILGKNIRGK